MIVLFFLFDFLDFLEVSMGLIEEDCLDGKEGFQDIVR